MRRTQLVAALLVCAVIGLVCPGSAQNAAPPTIFNVTMDAAGDQLTISGTGFGPAPLVTIDGQPVTVLLGSTDTQVTVITPSVLLTTAGSYRLTVVDSVRQVGEVFVVASHAGIVAPVGGTAIETPTAAAGAATRLATPIATGLAGITAPQPLDSVVTLTGFEDPGFPYQTALGYQALLNTTGGFDNTALGYQALTTNTTGSYNMASGSSALFANTGSWNTASGYLTLYSNTTGIDNTAAGSYALYSNTTGSYNTASGFSALFANTGSSNTASGFSALFNNTTGGDNTAAGLGALGSNTTGSLNTALGTSAGGNATIGNYNLFLGAGVTGTSTDTNTIRIGSAYNGGVVPPSGQNKTFIAGIYGTPITGGLPVVIDANGLLGTAADPGSPYTTAVGYQAAAMTTGPYNTASGYAALYSNTTGFENTASGVYALLSNSTGAYNTASGVDALYSNTTGAENTASGVYALLSNSTGNSNVASGYAALFSNTTGFENTASGAYALLSNTTGYSNTALGTYAGYSATTGSNNLFLGANVFGTATDTNTIRLGLPYNGTNGQNQTFIAGIYGTPITGGLAVVIDANGQLGTAAGLTLANGGNVGIGTAMPRNPLEMGSGAYVSAGGVWTNASSRTLKDQIADLPASRALEAFERLKPVTFVYKASPTEAHVGFIAEDVPDLVATQDRRSLAAMDIVAVLTKVAQEQQITIRDLQARLARLESLLTDAAAAGGK